MRVFLLALLLSCGTTPTEPTALTPIQPPPPDPWPQPPTPTLLLRQITVPANTHLSAYLACSPHDEGSCSVQDGELVSSHIDDGGIACSCIGGTLTLALECIE